MKEDVFVESAKNAEEKSNLDLVKDMSKSKVVDMPKDKLTDENIDLQLNNITENHKKNWGQLRDAMETIHAKRFNQIMFTLPDREFVRVYLKSLEYFKPKVGRVDAGAVTTDKKPELKITILRNNKDE